MARAAGDRDHLDIDLPFQSPAMPRCTGRSLCERSRCPNQRSPTSICRARAIGTLAAGSRSARIRSVTSISIDRPLRRYCGTTDGLRRRIVVGQRQIEPAILIEVANCTPWVARFRSGPAGLDERLRAVDEQRIAIRGWPAMKLPT